MFTKFYYADTLMFANYDEPCFARTVYRLTFLPYRDSGRWPEGHYSGLGARACFGWGRVSSSTMSR